MQILTFLPWLICTNNQYFVNCIGILTNRLYFFTIYYIRILLNQFKDVLNWNILASLCHIVESYIIVQCEYKLLINLYNSLKQAMDPLCNVLRFDYKMVSKNTF